MMDAETAIGDSLSLLKKLIATPSVSRDESAAADLMEAAMRRFGLAPLRHKNNVWAMSDGFSGHKPTLLLNAHIDTVPPTASWTLPPFVATERDGRIYGLGSNDCGGGLVSLLAAFRLLRSEPLPFNLVYLASAEEEVSGRDGVESAWPLLPHIDAAIVGEPTGMAAAVAEKGLMVVDIEFRGRAGHAARGEGVNALYEALGSLEWIRGHRFGRVSPLLGPTLMQATVIRAGERHNVVPDRCVVTVDVRTNELYTNEEVLQIIRENVAGEATARSTRLRPSAMPEQHPLRLRCREMGISEFGSPTLSDQALMPCPSLKLGPGDSARSHSADEYITADEISRAVDTYLRLLRGVKDLEYTAISHER